MKSFKNIKWMAGLIPLVGVSCGNSDQKQDESPNVILIIADDMGIGDIGVYGQDSISTPLIDKMAGEGIMFTNMYTGSTVSAPSRACLLTGRDTGHSSVRGNPGNQIVNDNELTLGKVFKNAGYVTGAIGKWGMGSFLPYDDPQRKGFDYFYGYINMWHAHNFFPEYLYENGKRVPLNNKNKRVDGVDPWADTLMDGKGVAEIRNEYAPFLFDKKALSFIEENKDKKFFLYLAYNTPHANNEARPDGMEVPDYHEFAGKDWPSQEKGFAAMIRNLDNSVGMVIEKLKELGIDKNTLVMFCSDNGPHQEGGHKMEFFNSNGKYKGMKRDLYEGGVKTPFIARWPEKIKAGSTSEEVFAFWDFLATFSDITGAGKPAVTEGISFLPSLTGKEQKEKHDYLYYEFYEKGGKQSVLKDQWKLLRQNVRGPAGKITLELYDISKDPEELTDIADQHPEIVKQLEGLFKVSRTDFALDTLFNSIN
jgi:arylsulfatase A-like enzyme